MGNVEELIIVTQTGWEFEELCRNTRVVVRKSFGLNAPKFGRGTVWRVPQEPLTHFLLSGAEIVLQAPGAFWLDSVPERFKKRLVVTLRAAEVMLLPDEFPIMFWKFAEAKNSLFQGEVRSLNDVKQFLVDNSIPSGAVLQYSEPVKVGNEYRFFIADGVVVGSSLYVSCDTGEPVIVYDGGFAVDGNEIVEAEQFVREVLKHVSVPDGVVIDVAVGVDGFFVLEANPAWCSGWYDCGIDGVVDSIVASNRFNKKWVYTPDVSLMKRLGRKPALRFD